VEEYSKFIFNVPSRPKCNSVSSDLLQFKGSFQSSANKIFFRTPYNEIHFKAKRGKEMLFIGVFRKLVSSSP
jgi:hypothetical protein